MNINDLAITSLETIQAYDIQQGSYLFTLDELQSATIAQTEEKVDITGKQGRKLTSLKRNKAVTVSGNNGMISFGLLASQAGSTFEDATEQEVQWYDYLTVKNNKAETSYKAAGTAGAEIQELWTKKNSALDQKLTQDSTAAAGKFSYDPATKQITLSGITDGTEIFVIYKRKIASASVMENKSDNYAAKVQLYIDAIGEDKCGNVYHVQFYIPKADFSGEFSFEMGDSQSVHAFEAEALASGSGCGASAGGGVFWTCTVFGADAEDAD